MCRCTNADHWVQGVASEGAPASCGSILDTIITHMNKSGLSGSPFLATNEGQALGKALYNGFYATSKQKCGPNNQTAGNAPSG